MSLGRFTRDVCVIGGCGHVGLPLAMTFADCGFKTLIYDINTSAVDMVRRGEMPFNEKDGPQTLNRVMAGGNLEVDDKPDRLSECRFLVLVVGTPVDEHLNPNFTAIDKALNLCNDYLREGQVLILRSTVFPGTTRRIQNNLDARGAGIHVAFCPERVVQGLSLQEFRTTPQIISAFDPQTVEEVRKLFSPFSCEIIEMIPTEAELSKLLCNAWRYVQFATANQFYVIATHHGLDFNRILHGCKHNYPRMKDLPGAGFAAGPCLMKDTMQLAAYSRNNFVIGHAAMMINEGLPAHVVHLAKREMDLSKMTAGVLGMAFKAESDDMRDSLSYKLRKLLSLECKKVLCTDPYVRDASLVSLQRVLEESDVLFLGTPHRIYRELVMPPGKRVIDVWDALGSDAAKKVEPR